MDLFPFVRYVTNRCLKITFGSATGVQFFELKIEIFGHYQFVNSLSGHTLLESLTHAF